MSVLRHHGGSFLQRRLTKMYSDTKSSCESVTTASKANDDPELVALHRRFRIQKDRLLAWGLEWSDASAAHPNDIDESLTAAGFSDVVASVMSSIQEILNEAERLQHVHPPDLPPKASSPQDLLSKDDLSHLPVKAHWTEEDIKCSNALLGDLASYIDTLYDLSRSRRDMSMSISSAEQTASRAKSRPGTTAGLLTPAESFQSFSGASKHPPFRDLYESPVEMKSIIFNSKLCDPPDISPYPNSRAFAEPPWKELHRKERSFTEPSPATKHLFIDGSALQLSGFSHARSPPPYEQVAASANSRVIGRIKTSASPFLTGLTKESTIPILVEFTPMMLETRTSITIPASDRLEKLHRSLDQLVENARVSHLGLLRFLGYFIDMANTRYAFIFQMPIDYFPFLRNPSNLLKELQPKTLVSLFHSGDDHQDIPAPSLECRFRLAYSLLLAVLHLRSQNVVHGNISSSNILIFPGLKNANQDDIGSLTEDLQHPYLTSLAFFPGNESSPEPLSSSMYRHPEDKRSLIDEAAWSYDLYSLGLVLLEIGLWTPISRLWKMKYDNTMFKQRIENMYIKKLGSRCGSAYLHVVQLCLDAPNFHLSTEPMADLGLRLPQVFYYPALELVQPGSAFAFSANFTFTLSKIIWCCCSIDIFSPPPAQDLDDCLPLALCQDPGSTAARPFLARVEGHAMSEIPIHEVQVECVKTYDEKSNMAEKKIKKRTLKKLTNVDIPQEHLDEWNLYLMPKVSKLLQKVLRDSSESCSVNLMMTGEAADAAKTTICVTCTNVKKVRMALKKYFEIDKEGWDLIVLRGDIRRSKVPRRRRKPRSGRPANTSDPPFSQPSLNPYYQQKPLCGASIGAFRNEEHLPPVSYGGAILIDNMSFGMTVHHMLEPPSDDEDGGDECSTRSSDNGLRDIEPSFRSSAHTWPENDMASPSCEFEITDDEDGDSWPLSQGRADSYDDYWFSDDEGSGEEGFEPDDGYDDEDAASVGDTAGIELGEEPRLLVTQPAIDDVHQNFFPTLEDRDDEHLASHTLGYIHASSGIRRWTRDGIKHEIDWALIKIDDSRMDPKNVIFGSAGMTSVRAAPQRRRRQRDPYSSQASIQLNKVARVEELGGMNVHCCGRTSGLQGGQISKAMTLVKMHGRRSFSTSFSVDGNFGVPGDSGAWVFDKATGRVCGHVLAWSEQNRMAYIAPMQVLLEDIARKLRATKVTLPGCPDDAIASSPSALSLPAQPPPQSAAAAIQPYDGRHHHGLRLMPDQLPDIGRLSLGLDEPGVGRVGNSGRGFREVSTSLHRTGPPIITRTRELERQLA